MHPVRSITAVLLLLSLTVYASGDDPATAESVETSSVRLAIETSIQMHGPRENLSRLCRVERNVRGCTDFPEERLECSCEMDEDHWHIRVRASVRAVIHLSRDVSGERVAIHERMHLADLETGLGEHLRAIAAKPYQLESACRTYARVLEETPHLRVMMNGLRQRSNEKYGCVKKRDRF